MCQPVQAAVHNALHRKGIAWFSFDVGKRAMVLSVFVAARLCVATMCVVYVCEDTWSEPSLVVSVLVTSVASVYLKKECVAKHARQKCAGRAREVVLHVCCCVCCCVDELGET